MFFFSGGLHIEMWGFMAGSLEDKITFRFLLFLIPPENFTLTSVPDLAKPYTIAITSNHSNPKLNTSTNVTQMVPSPNSKLCDVRFGMVI